MEENTVVEEAVAAAEEAVEAVAEPVKAKKKSTGPSVRSLKKIIKETEAEKDAAIQEYDTQRDKAEHYFQENLALKKQLENIEALNNAKMNNVLKQLEAVTQSIALMQYGGK